MLTAGCGKSEDAASAGAASGQEAVSALAAGSEEGAEADAASEEAQAGDASSEQEIGEEAQAGGEDAGIPAASLEDGVYSAAFDTDGSMFHVNEACEGRGTLTVEDGKMTLHISLPSKNIVNLFPGLAEDAEKDGAELLEPTIDTVTYSDGMTEEVHGFDIPVTALDEEFDLAILGTKGKWYDHKVIVSDPVKEDGEDAAALTDLEDGEYSIEVSLEGGSGKASISSPATLIIEGGTAYARIEWSSPYYDYMIVGDEKYLPVNTEGNSVFEIPVYVFDEKMSVTADTTAMSVPHEIEYALTFDLSSLSE